MNQRFVYEYGDSSYKCLRFLADLRGRWFIKQIWKRLELDTPTLKLKYIVNSPKLVFNKQKFKKKHIQEFSVYKRVVIFEF